MLIRYMKGEFSGQYNVTVGVEFASRSVRVESGHDVKLQIWDTVVVSLFRLGRKLFEPSFVPSIKALQQCFSALPLISLRAWKLSECGLEKWRTTVMNKLCSFLSEPGLIWLMNVKSQPKWQISSSKSSEQHSIFKPVQKQVKILIKYSIINSALREISKCNVQKIHDKLSISVVSYTFLNGNWAKKGG